MDITTKDLARLRRNQIGKKMFTTKDPARQSRNQIGKKMFTTKDTKITKFGV